MSKHTKGPWEACGWRLWGGGTIYCRVRPAGQEDGPTTLIANCWGREADPDDFLRPDAESEANARLIAAAPDLLAALETLLNATNDVDGLRGCSERDLAAKAIAKAKGGAP